MQPVDESGGPLAPSEIEVDQGGYRNMLGDQLLGFGYPARPADPESRTPEEWIERAGRLPFDEVVELR